MNYFCKRSNEGEGFESSLSPYAQGLPLSKILSVLVGLLILSPTTVLAGSGARTVYSQDAQGVNSVGIELKVWQGYGLTINFIPTGETIKQVWLGDPTRISFTSNGNLCQKNSNSNNDTDSCGNGGATVIFLRQIKPISFPNMTTSSDGSTLLTVITSGSDGQKQYQFKLVPATGQPNYTSLVIKADSERPLPVVRTKPEIVSTVPTTTLNKTPGSTILTTPLGAAVTPCCIRISVSAPQRISLPRNDANALAYGLAIAHSNGQIQEGSITWKKAQDAIKLLRQGKSKEEAISRSGVKEEVFNQLIQWGQK